MSEEDEVMSEYGQVIKSDRDFIPPFLQKTILNQNGELLVLEVWLCPKYDKIKSHLSELLKDFEEEARRIGFSYKKTKGADMIHIEMMNK
jgi:hypothetical protein